MVCGRQRLRSGLWVSAPVAWLVAALAAGCSSEGRTGSPAAGQDRADGSGGNPADDASLPDASTARDAGRHPTDAATDAGTTDADAEERPSAVDYLVVSANHLLQTAYAFAGYREQTGHRAEVVPLADLGFEEGDPATSAVAQAVKERVRAVFEVRDEQRPFYVLIVGDAELHSADPSYLVPAPRSEVGWEPGYSDNGYADIDGDHVPDLALGRIPVSSNEEGLLVLEKVRRHETGYEPGPWNRRLAVYAGTGNFGPEVDGLIEFMAQKVFEELPHEFDLRFAYNNPSSVYYYAPFPAKVLEFLTWGSILTTYMGHGGGETNVPGLEGVVCLHRCPVLAFFACDTGNFLMAHDSDPERLMKQAGSPFELLVSQTTSHPYGNAILARELATAVFRERAPTFGEAVRRAKWLAMYGDDELRRLLDALAATVITQHEMDDVLASHMYTYNLLGDPALRMQLPPDAVTLELEDDEVPRGSEFAFSGLAPGIEEGTAHVTLEVDVSKIPWDLEPVANPTDPLAWPVIQANWDKAMNKVVASADVPITDGAFQGTLTCPPTGAGRRHLKVLAQGPERDGIAHRVLTVTAH